MPRLAVRPSPWPRPPIAVLLILLALLAGSCAPSDERRMRELVPELGETTCHVLLNGSDAELRRWYVDRGGTRLGADLHFLLQAFEDLPASDRAFLLPSMRRLARVKDVEYDIGSGVVRVETVARLDDAELGRLCALRNERDRLRADETVSDEEKIRRLETQLAFYREHGIVSYEILILTDIGQLQAALGDHEAAYGTFAAALSLSEEIDFAGMTCQLLGQQAAVARMLGRDDEIADLRDRHAARAHRSRMAHQAARVEEFRATGAMAEGRLGAAHLHLLEARELCRRYKGEERELRYINNLAEFYADLACWDMVRSFVDQAEGIETGRSGIDLSIEIPPLRMAEAEALFQAGDVEEALVVAARTARNQGRRPYAQVHAAAHLTWVRLLARAGRLEEALGVIDSGIAQTTEDHLPGHERSFRLLLVDVLERLGRYEEAWRRLAQVRPVPGDPTGRIMEDARDEVLLEVRLSRRLHGDGPELAAALVRALDVLRARINADAPSVLTYLELQAFDEFRWLVHELVADDPRLGYAFDMAWRGLTEVARRDAGLPRDAAFPDAAAAVRGWVEARGGADFLDGWVAGEIHLVYVVTEDAILRWRRSKAGLVRDVVDWNPATMRSTVADVLAEISQPPDREDQPLSAATRRALGELARRLLPADLRARWAARADGGTPDRLWISADDALAQIPFATFDVSDAGAYRPLILAADTGYLRFFRAAPAAAAEPPAVSLVVGDPEIAPALQRRIGELPPLPGARAEAAAAGRRWQPATVLLGVEATKANVLTGMASARRIHVAAHHVRDAATPFLQFIPLAAGEHSGDITEAVLEASDILALDLRSCELAVLSGCASGAPYLDGSRMAPGLGEVFLDAGCGRVVQASWSVADPVVHHETQDSATGRESLEDGRRVHPFHWASPNTVVASLP